MRSVISHLNGIYSRAICAPRDNLTSGRKLALTWSLASTLKLQLTGANLLDREIYDPGVESPGFGFAAVLPQPGRRLYLRLITDL